MTQGPPSPPFKNTDGLSGAKKKTRRLFSLNPKLLDPVASKREREKERKSQAGGSVG